MVPELDGDDRAAMLRLARATLIAWTGRRPPPPIPDRPVARWRRGAFVTLSAEGALRGCIGHVAADRPLGEVVRDMALAAARDDPRFPPVDAAEMVSLRVEISVLTTPRPVAPVRPEDIRIGRDGLIVRSGGTWGLLLPQVAVDHAMTAVEFLAATCRKAGLGPGAWCDPRVLVEVFEAEVFGEPA